MRLKMMAGGGLSLLLTCVPATAQQGSPSCAEREQQIKSAQNEVIRLTEEAVAKKPACLAATTERRSEPCGAYAAALTRQREKKCALDALVDDPGWRACPASAAVARYKTTSAPPVQNTNPGSTQPGGRDPSGGGTNSASTGGSTRDRGGWTPGTSGSGGTPIIPVSTRTPDSTSRIPKGPTTYSNRTAIGARITGRPPNVRPNRFRPHVSHMGRSRMASARSGGRGGHRHR